MSTALNTSENRTSIEDILKTQTFAEFFAGIGLMRMGLEKKGWQVVYANDIDEDKYKMYSAEFTNSAKHFHLGDIHELRPDEIPSFTLATASFPCNDLSLAGMRKGLEGKQSSAYWGLIQLLDEMAERRPPLVLLENVVGFLTSNEGRDFQEALLALNRLGYIVDPFIIDASRFVPQSRVRLFVVGHLQVGCESWRMQTSSDVSECDVRPKSLIKFIHSHPEIVWDIRRLPRLPKSSTFLRGILEILPKKSPLWWNDDRRVYLINQMSEKHARQLKIMKQANYWSYGTVFRRIRKGRSMAELRTDGVAGCLRTPRGGSGRQILVEAGYGQVRVRLLTPRECARLMGAEGFTIDVAMNKALFGFGDAVCVPVIEWIAEFYLNPILNAMRKRMLTY